MTATVTDTIQAVGGLGSFVVACGLAWYASQQTRAVRDQADAAAKQVGLRAEEAETERARRLEEDRRRVQEQSARDQAVQQQLDALERITDATRDAARAQLQPLVLSHAHGAFARGPREPDLGEGQISFDYYVSNEGTGPALNIEHGVEVAGHDFAFGDGMQFRTAGAGEFLPPLDADAAQPIPSRFLRVVVNEGELPVGWNTLPRTYWARFENVFGERFETRNPSNPQQPFVFARIDELASRI
jgi:hypothetical protein